MWVGDDYTEESKLIVLDTEVANAEPVELDGAELGPWWWVTTVIGDRAIAQGSWGELNLIDASDSGQVEIQHSSAPGWGSCYRPAIDGDTVYCPMGPYGLAVVNW